jgi:hypothetical protein
MDPRKPYLVFITADGPSKGLYVAQKTNSGFIVRENPGGSSTLVFDYRIVANPIDTTVPSRFGAPIPDRGQAVPQFPKHAP